jgi:diguanylate cyclase (GGDEF)-like protein
VGSVTTALIAACASLATLLVAGLALVFFMRRRRGSEERLALAVSDLNIRMEAMVKELTTAVERAEEESRRSRAISELGGTIDIDEVLARSLEAAGAMPGADAALITVDGIDGKPYVATLGLSAEEAAQQAVIGPPDGRRARSISITYRYPPDELSENGSLIHSGLAVPLPGETGSIGCLVVFSRSESRLFAERDMRDLEELAARAGPAIDNARRFREARQLADLDALTGLHNRRYFHEILAREVARAHRYDRKLALIVFDLDDFKEVNDRIGHLAGDSVLAEAAERVREVVRSADIACRVGGDEFAVILPESALADGDQLYRRIEHAVTSRPIANIGMLKLSAGVTELRADDDPVSFFQRADEALYRAKEGGKGRAVAATGAPSD